MRAPRVSKKSLHPRKTHQHAVVQLRAALLVIKDAADVQLERALVGLDGDRDGLLRGGLLEGDLAAGEGGRG
jgi:hypothetical protein